MSGPGISPFPLPFYHETNRLFYVAVRRSERLKKLLRRLKCDTYRILRRVVPDLLIGVQHFPVGKIILQQIRQHFPPADIVGFLDAFIESFQTREKAHDIAGTCGIHMIIEHGKYVLEQVVTAGEFEDLFHCPGTEDFAQFFGQPRCRKF